MKREILAVRLTAREKRLLDETRLRLGVSRSEVVREAITRYAAQSRADAELTAAERLAPWLGRVKGADPRLSTDAAARFRALLAKRHARRSR